MWAACPAGIFHTMTVTETAGILNTFLATFPGAVLSCAVSVDANTTVTVSGMRGNVMIARALARGGLADNVDQTIWVAASAFTTAQITALPGRTLVTGAVTYRITGVKLHACGGILQIVIGEYDRVAG